MFKTAIVEPKNIEMNEMTKNLKASFKNCQLSQREFK
jgi:hypothetical protein